MAEDGLVVPSSGPARIEVLGPLRAWASDGRELTPSGALQRRLLALLVLRRGRAVPTDTLVEALWPDRRPGDPVAALQNHVTRLRRTLPEGALASTDAGYRLDPAAVDVDADRLLHLLAGGPDIGTGTGTGTGDELAALLARWHGPAYAELEELDEARVEAARLEECRHRGHEWLAERRLERGELDGLVADLVALTDLDPLRERPRSLLMAALAATGRTVEALRVFDDFRRLLADELGISPSPALAAQHAALLGGVEEPAPAAPRPIRSRLPVPTTGLIGREPLVAELVRLAGSHRLVSLIGPAGVGKTRLAIEMGDRLGRRRPDRPVVWCELAQADVASAADVVSAALGIDARPGVTPAARLVDVIGDDELVVVLDNCEHVIDVAAGLVERLLAGCPNLSIVTTSRERLRLPGEQVRTVPTLLDGGDPGAAVDLFVERALAVSPGFSPGAGECERITEIVGRLDGLPLAIELVAARLHSLDLGEVAAGLDERFSLLATGRRTSARHGSLGAAVAWSFSLLTPDLQRCFAALSVFSRSFSPADAAAVCGLATSDAVEMLSQLVERSLVQRTLDRRYVLLETLRAFGAGERQRSGDADRVSECHARWMVEWVEQADRALATPGRAVLSEIDDALPELRVAMAWLLGRDLTEHAGRLVHGLLNYGMLRLRPDVLAWADTVLAADPGSATPMAPRLWAASAYAAWLSGDMPAAAERAARALEVERTTGARPVARVRTMLGNIELFEGRLGGAADWYQQAIDASTGDSVEWLFSRATQLLALGYAGDPRVVTLADGLAAEIVAADTALAAYLWYCTGEAVLGFDVETARERLVRAVETAERTDASFVRGVAGASKASIEARTGDPAVAVADYRWLIGHWRRAGVWSTQWTMLRSVAGLLERMGRHTDAAVLEAAVRSTEAGHRIFGADAEALDALGHRLRTVLGDDRYERALARGARLDGDAAVEHALRALAQPATTG